MILLGFFIFLLGGIIGLGVRQYLSQFSNQIVREIYDTYLQIFPKNPPRFQLEKASLQPIKCGAFSFYFFSWAMIFLLTYFVQQDFTLTVFWSSIFVLLFIIAKIDWHYQIIDLPMCQLLGVLGVLGAYFSFIPLNLRDSIFSLFVGFILFWIIFYIAKFFYGQETLGRGDYWLVGALSSFQPWQNLPLMIFVACVSGLIYAFYQNNGINIKNKSPKKLTIPFGPFLILGWLCLSL